jgi:death-on-curing protein
VAVKRPVFVLRSVVEAIHDAQLAEHGGASGVRDSGLLDSALARPLNLHAHGENDRSVLAASYAFGIVRNHPFVDGNKRTAFLAAYVFLRLNGRDLIASEVAATTTMLALAAGTTSEADYAEWLRANTKAARRP